MDHAFWPFVTTKFYIDQTGDLEILLRRFRILRICSPKRGTDHDTGWDETYGKCQRTEGGVVYFGSVLEHLLLQNLCAFYDVGAHNEMRLHGADWNDALDMAWENGESVAFTSAYAGNLKEIAHCIRLLEQETGCKLPLRLQKRWECCLQVAGSCMRNVEKKRGILDAYLEKCAHNLSGQTMIVKSRADLQQSGGKSRLADGAYKGAGVDCLRMRHTDGLMAIMTIIRIRWRAVKTERYWMMLTSQVLRL